MGRKLYVGNLSYRTTEQALRAAFEADGRSVASVAIIMDRDTNRPKGFAFVEMGTDEEAQAAMNALDGQPLDGRNLRVNEAQERQPRRSFGGGGGGGGYGGGGGGGGGYGGAGGGRQGGGYGGGFGASGGGYGSAGVPNGEFMGAAPGGMDSDPNKSGGRGQRSGARSGGRRGANEGGAWGGEED